MYIHVKVQPNAKRDKLQEMKADHFTAEVKAPAERNLANERVRKLLAGHFGIPAKSVRLISGHHSPSKIFDISPDSGSAS